MQTGSGWGARASGNGWALSVLAAVALAACGDDSGGSSGAPDAGRADAASTTDCPELPEDYGFRAEVETMIADADETGGSIDHGSLGLEPPGYVGVFALAETDGSLTQEPRTTGVIQDYLAFVPAAPGSVDSVTLRFEMRYEQSLCCGMGEPGAAGMAAVETTFDIGGIGNGTNLVSTAAVGTAMFEETKIVEFPLWPARGVDPTEDWTTLLLAARAQAQANDTMVEARAENEVWIRLLEVVDADGAPVPGKLCSAAGWDYE